MCHIAGVSRSGYYQYINRKVILSPKERRDQADFERIQKAYQYRNRKKGARQIKMTMERHFGVIMNSKKIRRIMKKYGLFCPIRKANPYRRLIRSLQSNQTFENRLNRQFDVKEIGKVFVTDITYLYYNGNIAYLSSIMDLATKEISSHQVSETITMPFVINSVHLLADRYTEESLRGSYLHSDQGFHYTNPRFQYLVKQYQMGQSMSRKGNCWDNAPKESFFGHMKDELNLHLCSTFQDLVKEIDDCMDYYNNHRYQWRLSKMTPSEYRDYLRFELLPQSVSITKQKDDYRFRQSSLVETS